MHLKKNKNETFKKIKFLLEVLVFGFLSLISPYLHGQETGFKYLKNYTNEDYDHQPQNWGIVQAKNGIIYVANHGGVLEFDGVSWRIIGIPEYATVRSLAIDETGTIYVGGVGEIGYLAPDEKGTLTYHSLVSHLPEDQRNFSQVYRTYTSKKGIYFQSKEFLFRWDPKRKEIKPWEPKERFYFAFLCKGKLFIRPKTVGLAQMVNDKLQKVPGGEMFKTRKIYMMVPYDSKSVLIGTRANGFYIYNGTTIIPFPTDVDDYLKKNSLYNGIRLSSGDFALATLQGGVVIMDPWGRMKNVFNKSYGLLDDTVYNIFEDYQGNLWLGLSKGISKIEYVSPISVHDDRSGLPGLVFSIERHQNHLYVGTSTGLYYLESSLKFRLAAKMSSNCWDLHSFENSLLAATADGVFQVDVKNNTKRRIIEESSFVLLPSKHYPGRTWCGTKSGLVILSEKDGKWTEEHQFKNIKQEIRSIAEDQKGNLWLVTVTGGVVKINFPIDTNNPSITQYVSSNSDLPDGVSYVAAAAGHVMFATPQGLFQFDENAGRFIPDGTLGDEFAGGPNSRPVFRVVEDNKKNIWFHSASRNFLAVPGPGGRCTIKSMPFRRIPDTYQANTIYPDPDGKTTWFGSQGGGLIRFDTAAKKDYNYVFPTLIRKVVINGKLIFDGYKYGTPIIPTIDHKDRKNLHFEFAASFFEAESETQYRYYLEGLDDHWSGWSLESSKDFTILDAGFYTFRVRAENVYEQEGQEDVFQFKILPPWYQTWWAYVIYGIGFFLLTFFIVKWRSRRLEHEKEKLELTVKQRTKEINEKNEQLKKQTDQLKEQSEKLKEMDKIKSRFFANISHEFRTPLTLIMGPIEQMLSEPGNKKQKKTLNLMLRSSQHVLTLINRLLELSRFDSGQTKLKAACQNIVPFLKGITSSFHNLAHQHQLNLEFHSEEDEICLYFNNQKIEEVMNNLLSNAVKFTPEGGNITVSTAKEGEAPGIARISVRDTGIGISKEQFGHIFDRFYQADYLKEKGRQGTGIGLALVKEIVDLHHGKIDLHSQEGKGTEFVIRLPMGDEHLKQEEMAEHSEIEPDLKRPGPIEVPDIPPEEEEGNGDTPPQEEPEADQKDMILVVEDHADVRNYIRSSLEPLYTVIEADGGKEGITKAKKKIPDLIVSDIMMPGVDGYRLCREIKRDIKTSHIPIILLTAKASEKSIIKGLETGADDYITKPFNSKLLGARIKNLIDLRRQMQLKIQREKTLLPPKISVSSMDDKFLKEFQDIVDKNLEDPDFNIDTLCDKLYMGRSTLFRKIQAITGETPNQYIVSSRLQRAAQLLKKKSGNITDVAFEVGFSSTAYFSKCFKEKFHQSPTSFQASESSENSEQESVRSKQ